ncbi:MAG: CBS domain-containing protein [Planctomycetes bacterium]|nr:CBS domain-containing protein [Planctomycetota bacterium]
MNVQEIMTTTLEAVAPDSTVMEAAMMMDKHDVGCLAVMDGGEVVGAVTDRDIVIRTVALGKDPRSTATSEIMTSNPVFCRTDDDVETAAHRMMEQKIRRLIVQDANGTPVGLVSLGDIAARAHQDELAGEVVEDVCSCP